MIDTEYNALQQAADSIKASMGIIRSKPALKHLKSALDSIDSACLMYTAKYGDADSNGLADYR